MICPQCRTQNDDDYVFCVNCGVTIGDKYKTAKYSSGDLRDPLPVQLPPTVYVKEAEYRPHPAPFVSEPTFERYAPASSSKVPLIVGLVVVVLAVVGGAAYLISRQVAVVAEEEPEILPQYLGLFVKGENGKPPVEIKLFETGNASEGRNAILNDSQVPKVGARPEFVLYADASEMPLSDLKLVRLDSITDDGRSKYGDFQAAIIDNRPAMKRIMLPQPLTSGRYAFVLFSGFFNEGRHRFWPFEILSGDSNGLKFDQEIVIQIKLVETPTPPEVKAPEVSIPAGATIAYCNATDVRMRTEPTTLPTQSKVIGKLSKGQKVYVLNYHEFSYLDGRHEVWARVQTETGKQAWVFNKFLDHGQK